MISFKEDKKVLIASDYKYSPVLFRFKNAHPELDIKLMDLKELKDMLSFTYLKDPIPYLIRYLGYEYNKAKKIVNILKASNISINQRLKAIYEELKEKGYIPQEKNKLDLYQLNIYNIYLFEDDEDYELISLLNKHGLNHHLLHCEDLDIKENEFYLHPNILSFTTKFEQYFYLFSNLRRILIEHPEKKDRISVMVDGGEDLYYISYFSSIFKIDYFINLSSEMIRDKYIGKKVEEINQNRSFEFTEDELKNYSLCQLKKIIDNYQLNEMEDFDFAFLNLIEIVNSKRIEQYQSNKGIEFYSSFFLNPDSETYILNFVDDVFYKTYKDNNVISDRELYEVGANPSYLLTKLDKRFKHNTLKYMNIKLLSRVEQHLDEKLYDSPFIKELHWEEYLKHQDLDSNGTLTSLSYNIYKAYRYDEAFYRKKDGLINGYDHKFKGISNSEDLFKNRSFSVSRIKEYVSCPFKYLCSILLPYNDEEKHNAWKGTLIHAVLEHIYDDDYDYEKEFARGRNIYYKEMEKEQYEPTKKEEIFLDIIAYWLRPIALMIRKEKTTAKLYFPLKKDYEYRFNVDVASHAFKGSVDKILFTDASLGNEQPTNGSTFYTIVDYKSGSHGSNRFNPLLVCTGYDIQLPFYYLALKEDPHFDREEAEIGGMGIRHIYGSNIKDAFFAGNVTNEKILYDNLKIDGLFYDSSQLYSSFSEDNLNKNGSVKSKGTKGISSSFRYNYDPDNNTHPFYLTIGNEIKPYSLEEMIEDVKRTIEENIASIMEGDFSIAPISNDILKFDTDNLTCRFCPYRNVCYREISDARNIGAEKITERFLNGEEEKKEEELDA